MRFRSFSGASLILIASLAACADACSDPLVQNQPEEPEAVTIAFTRNESAGEVGKQWKPGYETSGPLSKQAVIRWFSSDPSRILADRGLTAFWPGRAIACVQVVQTRSTIYAAQMPPASDLQIVMEPVGKYPDLDGEILEVVARNAEGGPAACAVFSVVRK